MRRLALFGIFALLPFLSGCLSGLTLDKVNATTTKTLPDILYHVEKAAVTKDKHLWILFEGCLANATQTNRFVLTIPLQQIQVNTGSYNSTNKFTYGVLMVPRNAIHQELATKETAEVFSKIASVGALVTIPDGSNLWDYVENYKPLSGAALTLYPIRDLKSASHYDWPPPLEFIYIDAEAKQDFTVIQVEQVKVNSGKNYGYYFFLPLTIPLDIVALPIEIPFLMWVMSSIKC